MTLIFERGNTIEYHFVWHYLCHDGFGEEVGVEADEDVSSTTPLIVREATPSTQLHKQVLLLVLDANHKLEVVKSTRGLVIVFTVVLIMVDVIEAIHVLKFKAEIVQLVVCPQLGLPRRSFAIKHVLGVDGQPHPLQHVLNTRHIRHQRLEVVVGQHGV